MKPSSPPCRDLNLKNKSGATTRRQNGFTLIEVMMVMSIFSIGILAIMTLHVNAIHSNVRARTILMTSTLLANQFEKLISMDYTSTELGPGEKASRVENGFLIEHTAAATQIPNIKQIHITVTQNKPPGRRLTATYYKRSAD